MWSFDSSLLLLGLSRGLHTCMNFAWKPVTWWMICIKLSGFAVYTGLCTHHQSYKLFVLTTVLWCVWFLQSHMHETPSGTVLGNISHSFHQTLLEIAFITETMIESSKSGKSIGCSVAINNRLETSRHWWNLRPFLCGGLSAVAMHVNNACS